MQFHFYVSDDGEVLSNKDYPVTAPMLVVPEPDHVAAIPCECASELALTDCKVRYKLYCALTVKCPDVLFVSENGIIFSLSMKSKDEIPAPMEQE